MKETAHAKVHLDGEQAKNELTNLIQRATNLRNELKQLRIAKDPGMKEKAAELSKVESEITKLRRSTFNLDAVMKNLSGSSMKDLIKAQQVLSAQIRSATRNTREEIEAVRQKQVALNKVKAEIQVLRVEMGMAKKQMNMFAQAAFAFNRYFLVLSSTVASFVGVVMGMRKTADVFNEFEASYKYLSALTGVAGDELDWYIEKAKATSVAVTDNGVRFTSSAQDVVDAYTMIGSKMPVLLQNKEALAMVTEQAMTLAMAAKIKLEPAAEALTGTLNQMQYAATDASRVINTLAAGSKYGAAEIPYLNDVIERTGASARSAGLSIEQLVGVIEGVAPRFTQASEAGTAMRNIFLRLQGMDDEINPAIVGIDKALENLAKRNYSTSELMKMFTLRGFNMAKAMIELRGTISEMTEKVTGSSVAIEQAAIQSDANAAKLEQAKNKAQLLRIELGEKFAPMVRFSTNSFTYLLKALKSVMENWDLYRQLIRSTILVIVAYNFQKSITLALQAKSYIALKLENALLATKISLWSMGSIALNLYNLAMATLTRNTERATKAKIALAAASKATPWGLILAAITAVISALSIYRREMAKVTHLEKANSNIQKEISRQYDDYVATVNSLLSIIEDEDAVLTNRHKAIKNLQEIMPEYLGYLDSEGKLREHNNQLIQDEINKKLDLITLQVYEEELLRLEKERFALVRKRIAAAQEWEDKKAYHAQRDRALSDYNKAKEAVDKIEEAIKALRLEYTELSKTVKDAWAILGEPPATDDDTDPVVDDAVERTNAYNELTKAIQEAKNELAHFAAIGDFDSAMFFHEMATDLEAVKLVIDGIIRSGGDVNKFLEELTDPTQDLKEEFDSSMKHFMEITKEASDEYLKRKKEEYEHENKMDTEASLARINMRQKEIDDKIEMMKDWAKARADIEDEALRHGFMLYSEYQKRNTDVSLKQLEIQREATINNQYISDEAREKMLEEYLEKEAKIKEEAFRRQRRADFIQSLVNAYLAVSRALAAPPGFPLNAPSVVAAAAIGAIQSASILAQPIPQFFSGRYSVIGGSDGKLYNATYTGQPKTGLYSTPSLVAERGEELIVDAPTTRNLKLNYPHIIKSIMHARVPQFASGKYPDSSQAISAEDPQSTLLFIKEIQQTIVDNSRILHQLSEQLKRPIAAEVSLTGNRGLYEKDKQYQQLKDNAYN